MFQSKIVHKFAPHISSFAKASRNPAIRVAEVSLAQFPPPARFYAFFVRHCNPHTHILVMHFDRISFQIPFVNRYEFCFFFSRQPNSKKNFAFVHTSMLLCANIPCAKSITQINQTANKSNHLVTAIACFILCFVAHRSSLASQIHTNSHAHPKHCHTPSRPSNGIIDVDRVCANL